MIGAVDLALVMVGREVFFNMRVHCQLTVMDSNDGIKSGVDLKIINQSV